MSPTAEDLLKQALTLDKKDDETWDAEIRRRVEELESGAVDAISWAEVRERLFRGFE
jgi:putative addiction module component (TIGR02574 family)